MSAKFKQKIKDSKNSSTSDGKAGKKLPGALPSRKADLKKGAFHLSKKATPASRKSEDKKKQFADGKKAGLATGMASQAAKGLVKNSGSKAKELVKGLVGAVKGIAAKNLPSIGKNAKPGLGKNSPNSTRSDSSKSNLSGKNSPKTEAQIKKNNATANKNVTAKADSDKTSSSSLHRDSLQKKGNGSVIDSSMSASQKSPVFQKNKNSTGRRVAQTMLNLNIPGRTVQSGGTEVCREIACENISSSGGYCRLHYIKNWKRIKRKEMILRERKLNTFIEELVAKYPDKYIDAIRQDLSSEAEFAKVIVDLDLDESVDEFNSDDDDAAEDIAVDTIKRDFDDDGEGF